ncbi:IAA-alanine resistance protein 1 isoform X2 [Cynara cardunculus var. scolymus]|uniref:IAA-alanine resistance protein 1 isoform X2 n=1 Tax=Cynara cardunculus var. scolymus TaxID=59895 RepID=UPI000D6274CA|nr:IAA-alanine resistance protein 1 isoform X2 [Cynara cardunculus var. scolymus]
MMVIHHCKKQIYSLLLILVLTVGFNFEASFGHQCQHSSAPAVHESHVHHHNCDHSHGHHHHHHDHDLGMKKLPEELAEEEDLRLEYVSHHDHDHDHYHGGGSELTSVGLWIHAMGCSLLVSLASLVCLILLPLIFFQGKPSKALVDALAVFGAGAMLGDAFLHQLPHAFGGGHSHSHDNHVDDVHQHIASGHDHSHSHSHSIEDLSVGLSILFGIVVFLFVEKVVRYVEDMSGGVNSWGHGHHHHHKSESLKDSKGDDDNSEEDGSTSETSEKIAEIASGESLKSEKQSESSHLRKRNTSTNVVADKIDSGAENGPKSNIKSSIEKEPAQSSTLVFGYLNLFSDGVHNFTDGMALGSAFLLYGSVGGWSRTLFLLAHELPQEEDTCNLINSDVFCNDCNKFLFLGGRGVYIHCFIPLFANF